MHINYTNIPVSQRLKILTTATENQIRKGKRPSIHSFSIDLNNFKDEFVNKKHTDAQIKRVMLFAERLVGYGYEDFAGVVYSFLLKITNNLKLAEEIALKELALAKRTRDPIHICARISDIEKIYKIKAPNSPEHIKWIRENKKYLNKLVKHYDYAKKNYRTMIKKARPKEYYEKALANSHLNLAKMISKQYPKEALNEIKEAQEILQKLMLDGSCDIAALERDLGFAGILSKNIKKNIKR